METFNFFSDVDPEDLVLYESEIYRLLEAASVQISNIKPSDWYEQNRYLSSIDSSLPGQFSYDNSPYTREIVDCLAEDHPARKIAVMKGAQIGFSSGVIIPGIGWIISQSPGNILFLVGHEELTEPAMNNVDLMIDGCGIRNLIKHSTKRAKSNKSGDTDKEKHFPDGFLKLGVSNHKTLRQLSMKYGFIDDFDGMKSSSKESGDTLKLIDQRFVAYAKTKKIFYISTPELEETSNIMKAYLKGDQRKYHIKCPCCSGEIYFEWEIVSLKDEKTPCGITWEVDSDGRLIVDSVGYTCQKCHGFFDDRNKSDLLRAGRWVPTAKPSEPGFYSYHISALYAPHYMDGWAKYVQDYIDANPPDAPRDEEVYKTFMNLGLGYPYKPTGKSASASALQKNIRPYEVGIVPEKLSLADGNGRIVMLTCASDMNGTEDDARLDYEVIAWAESGAKYSVTHGSIGTFIPRDKGKTPREKWTYKHGAKNSVWPVFKEIVTQFWLRDSDKDSMKIFITGVDTGVMPNYAYQFVDNANEIMVSLKGDDYDLAIKETADKKSYKKSSEKSKLYLVATNHTKNVLSRDMGLKWDADLNDVQPMGFINFPSPSEGKYQFNNYFSHFEAEEKVIDAKTKKFIWKKKSTNHQNHLYDCHLYNGVVRDIYMDKLFETVKIKNGTWRDYCDLVLGRKKY